MRYSNYYIYSLYTQHFINITLVFLHSLETRALFLCIMQTIHLLL